MHNEIIREYVGYQWRTTWYAHANECNAPELSYLALGLAGEAGEFADAVKKIVREVGQADPNAYWKAMNEGARDKLINELGDVLWYLSKLTVFLGLSLEDLMVDNTVKLHERWGIPNGVDWPFAHITFEEAKEAHNVYQHQTIRP